MARNVKHMRWWPRPWEYDKAEAWLTEQARLGWRLKSIGVLFVKFTREDPADLRYRCILYDNAMLPGEEEALVQAYRDGGWKYIGYKSNQKVFVTEADGATADPTNSKRQQKLARKRIHAKVIWVIVSVLLYMAGFCWFIIDHEQYLNITMNYEISLSLVTLWFVNYWISSIFGLIEYFQSNTQYSKQSLPAQPRRITTAFWIIHVVLLIVIFVPGPYFLIRTFVEKHEVAPTMFISDMIDSAQLQVQVKGGELVFAEEGYGVCYPYHKFEYGMTSLVALGSKSDDADIVFYTYAQYKALFRAGADRLGDRLSGQHCLAKTFVSMDEPMPSMDDTMGFDRLWRYDDEWEHIVVAVKGTDVFYIIFEGPLNSDQLALFLINKITDEQEDPAP